MAIAAFVRKTCQVLALVLMAPALLLLAALPVLAQASDLNNGKFERPPVGPAASAQTSAKAAPLH